MRNKKLSAPQIAVIMFLISLGSRLVGFVREMVYADAYGTSYIMDAYFLSQSIPLIIAGAFLDPIGVAYMPVFSETYEKNGAEEGFSFTNKVITIILLICMLVITIEIIFSEPIVSIFARGFSDEAKRLTTFFLRITLVCIVFTCLSSILIAFLQYKKRFIYPALLGYIIDLTVIGAVIISTKTRQEVLILGLFFGGLFKLLFLCFIAKSEGYRYSFSVKIDDYVKKVFSLAIPVFLSASLGQINAFVDKTLAAGLEEGAISSLNYGYMLCGIIPALTTSIIGTILYPEINKAANRNDEERFNILSQKSVTVSLMITIPTCLGILAFSKEIIQSIYEHGSFTAASTEMTAAALFYYGIGMIFTSMRSLLVQILYSLKGMKYATISSLMSITINIVLDLVLVKVMGHRGLALATSVSAAATCFFVVAFLKRKYRNVVIAPHHGKMIKVVLISLVSVLGARGIFLTLSNTTFHVIIKLVISVLLAVIIYIVSLWLFKFEELSVISDVLSIRRSRNK